MSAAKLKPLVFRRGIPRLPDLTRDLFSPSSIQPTVAVRPAAPTRSASAKRNVPQPRDLVPDLFSTSPSGPVATAGLLASPPRPRSVIASGFTRFRNNIIVHFFEIAEDVVLYGLMLLGLRTIELLAWSIWGAITSTWSVTVVEYAHGGAVAATATWLAMRRINPVWQLWRRRRRGA